MPAVRAGAAAIAVVAVAALATPRSGGAQAFTDPVGDFRAGYAGPTTPDLDVTGGQVFFNGSSFIFTGTLAGAVPGGAPADQAYIYGVNRGGSANTFAALGLPGIVFDAVLILRPNGPDVVNLCPPPAAACSTPLLSGVTFAGNTFEAIVPAALLPTNGLSFADYRFNLWPRLIGRFAGNANQEIPDFAPDATTVGPSVTPEPATLALLAPALLGLAAARRRRPR